MRGRAGSVPEISVGGLEILPYEHFIPVSGMNGGMNSVNSGGTDSIVLHCHIISIPFNRSDTALRVTKAIVIGPKVKIFVFGHVCFVSRIGATIRP